MLLKAEISIRDESGRLFKGIADLHLQGADSKKKVAIKSAKVKESRSKIIARLREFKSQGFFKAPNKKSINEVKEKLRTKGITRKVEQIQPYLTQMIVNNELDREQITRDGKKLFLYFNS